MNEFKIHDNILYPVSNFKFNGLLCGFTLPYYGNFALTRKSILSGKSTEENRCNLAKTLKMDINSFFSPHQIHSNEIIIVDEDDKGKGSCSIDNAIKGDACITDRKNIVLLVTWADCIPVLFYDQQMGIIGAIHAGWKGTNLQIIEKTICRMLEMGSKVETIFSIIGPGIRSCCYKVGQEFLAYFENYKNFFRYDQNDIYFDLAGCVNKKCIEAVITNKNIEFFGKCNSCNISPEFFSCRRQGMDLFEGQAAFICMT
jgi:YfiH family protein